MDLAVTAASTEEIALLQEMVDIEATLTDSKALHDHNRVFHRQIYRATHNPYLNEMLDNLRIHLSLLRNTTYELPERTLEAKREHRAIVDALTRRDRAAARGRRQPAYSQWLSRTVEYFKPTRTLKEWPLIDGRDFNILARLA